MPSRLPILAAACVRRCMFAALAGLSLGAAAAFPEKPITIVSPYPPGGGADSIIRLLAPSLQEALKQPLVIDSKAGASGNIATDFVVRAPADGHTLLINNNTLTINASIGGRQAFDLTRDLQPIGAVAGTPVVIAVNPSTGWRSLADLIAHARRNPGKLSYASCGNGTAQHFAAVQLGKMAGIEMNHVPYKGCSAAIIDLVAGNVPIAFNTVANLDAQAKAGRVRNLAVTSAARLPSQPDVPTVAQTPGLEGFVIDVWFGLFAPAKTPPDVVKRLEAELMKAASAKEYQDALAQKHFSRLVLNADQLRTQVQRDLVHWKRLADEFKVVAD